MWQCLSFKFCISIQLLCISEHCQMIAEHPEKRSEQIPPVAKLFQLPSIFRKKIFFPNFKYK